MLLQWRGTRRHYVSNYWQVICLFNSLFRLTTKKILKLCIPRLLWWGFIGIRWIPLWDRNAETVSMSWSHHCHNDTFYSQRTCRSTQPFAHSRPHDTTWSLRQMAVPTSAQMTFTAAWHHTATTSALRHVVAIMNMVGLILRNTSNNCDLWYMYVYMQCFSIISKE